MNTTLRLQNDIRAPIIASEQRSSFGSTFTRGKTEDDSRSVFSREVMDLVNDPSIIWYDTDYALQGGLSDVGCTHIETDFEDWT